MNLSAADPDQVTRDAALARRYRIVERLPITLQGSLNEQLSQWAMLFPFEQKQADKFLRGVESFTQAELDVATANLRTIESKMGVARWNFSRHVNSMENSGQLARSEYYGAWRRAVQNLFAVIEAHADPADTEPAGRRLIVTVLPSSLPFDSATVWDLWREHGCPVTIEGDARLFFELLAHGMPGIVNPRVDPGPYDAWLIDAGGKSRSAIQPSEAASISYLDCELLNGFRKRFLADLNTIPRDTHTASETIQTLRARDWSGYWPRELAADNRLKSFVVELFLSGNGSLIFSNAFVQWACSEVQRRARPRVLVARFGVRPKPKPFTGIAIFEDQAKVSTAPDVEDPENSAIDAGILARYVWLSAVRYREYANAVCVCIAEHLNSAWIVDPSSSILEEGRTSISPDALHRILTNWMAS